MSRSWNRRALPTRNADNSHSRQRDCTVRTGTLSSSVSSAVDSNRFDPPIAMKKPAFPNQVDSFSPPQFYLILLVAAGLAVLRRLCQASPGHLRLAPAAPVQARSGPRAETTAGPGVGRALCKASRRPGGQECGGQRAVSERPARRVSLCRTVVITYPRNIGWPAYCPAHEHT